MKKVATKILIMIAVISEDSVWYPTNLIRMMLIVLIMVLTTVTATETLSLIA